MTMDLKRGPENVLRTLQHYISGEMPGAIDTFNATTSAEMIAYLKSPYTFDGAKKISLVRNKNAVAVEYTPAAGTYTGTQLAAMLNGDGTFSANLTSDTVQDGAYLRVYDSTRAVAGSLVASDETGNAVLGWNAGFANSYKPLRDLASIAIRYENMEPSAFPAVHIRCDDGREVFGSPQMREYDVQLRLYEVDSRAPFGDTLYINLARYARLIADLLTPACGSRSMGGQVNTISLISMEHAREIETDGKRYYRAYIDFALTLTVQED